ncbi:MAG: hypothetical protein ACFE0O_04915 [Opitutales bacterium]
MLSRKNREREQFGLSFLDCICCGFGAILLLFVLTTGKKANESQGQMENAQEIIARLSADIEREQKQAEQYRRSLKENSDEIAVIQERKRSLKEDVSARTEDLALLLRRQSTLEDELRRLMEAGEALPTAEDVSLPVPNPEKRQYLTNFRMEGERVLLLVEASGGMLDTTIQGAFERANAPAEERRLSPKWQQTLDMIRWFIASINPASKYQIAFFNQEPFPVLENRAIDEWMDPLDTENTDQVLTRLEQVTPGGPANLEQAFQSINQLDGDLPDNIILIVDGLPTRANSFLAGDVIDEDQRIQMFLAARRVLPPDTPFNILLLPFEGDPTAAIFYWSLANITKGSLVTPSPTWPDLDDDEPPPAAPTESGSDSDQPGGFPSE